MHTGLALPHFGPSAPGVELPGWQAVRELARRADSLGFESLWLGDQPGGADPLVTLSALVRITSRPGIGTLALDAFLRPPAVLAKALATLDVVSGGRTIVGLGGARGEDAARLAEVCQVLVGMFGGGPFSFAGAHVRVTEARCLPLPVQRPHPPIWLAGGDDRLLDVVARHGQGWTTAWTSTPAAYGERLGALEAACARVGRDPTTVTRCLGLTALVGEDEADLRRRFRHLCDLAPAPGPASVDSFDEWRRTRLVGTVEEVGAQLDEWASLGIDTVVVCAAGGPFSVMGRDDVAMWAAACSLVTS
jgi:alkanesulfonate monooxygenase SsuD/methylene tetrahydromethanopterin reductase-like flavin-dependent oxidoreductase (luciferase family)